MPSRNLIYPTLVKGTITFNSALSGDMLVPLEGKGFVHSQFLGTIHLQWSGSTPPRVQAKPRPSFRRLELHSNGGFLVDNFSTYNITAPLIYDILKDVLVRKCWVPSKSQTVNLVWTCPGETQTKKHLIDWALGLFRPESPDPLYIIYKSDNIFYSKSITSIYVREKNTIS